MTTWDHSSYLCSYPTFFPIWKVRPWIPCYLRLYPEMDGMHPGQRDVWMFEMLCPLSCCSVAQSCPILCDPRNCSMPGFPVLHHFLEFAQTNVHWVSNAIQPSHPLLPTSHLALSLSQHQGLFQWVGSMHQVAKVLALLRSTFTSQ